MVVSGNVFESLPAREGQPSEFFENLRNMASSSRGLSKDTTGSVLEKEK